jgi:hypothetical protein
VSWSEWWGAREFSETILIVISDCVRREWIEIQRNHLSLDSSGSAR